MRRIVRVGAVMVGALLMAGCSSGADKQGYSQDVVERTVLVTQTTTPAASSTQGQGTPSLASATAPPAATGPTPSSQASAGSASPDRPSGSPSPGAAAKSASPRVAAVQEALRRSGHFTGTIDGVEGAATTAAIRAFQREHGLTVDGVAGPSFWDAVAGRRPSATATPSPSESQPDDVVDPAEAASSSRGCADAYQAWDAAVQADSASRAQRAHARAAAIPGCNPNRWLPSRSTTVHDPVSTHEKGSPCTLAEVGTYDGSGNVCTQDVTDKPHWN